METIENILSRRSIREYQNKPIEQDKIDLILKAGQAGPSCADTRDYSFIVVKDKQILSKMADCNGKYAALLKDAALGILVCGDLDRAFKPAKEYFVIDCSIACQNMILAANDLKIGTCWLGTYPQMDRVNNLKKLFNLPENIVPHSIISFGYPLNDNNEKAKYEEDRVHLEKW